MKTLKNFFDSFQDTMAAAAFAEAGEFESALQMMTSKKNSNKKILLGTEGNTPLDKTAQYAYNACTHLGTNLEVLHLMRQKELAETLVNTEKKTKEGHIPRKLRFRKIGVLYYPVFSENPLEEEVARFAVNRGDILFVVLNKDEGQKRKKGTYFASLLATLKCPVVVPQTL
jgi:hypothetical protein